MRRIIRHYEIIKVKSLEELVRVFRHLVVNTRNLVDARIVYIEKVDGENNDGIHYVSLIEVAFTME